MAKKNYMELLSHEIEFVSENRNWSIGKDDHYYYKTLGEQNFAAFDGRIVENLEYMMCSQNQIEGINPVSDIYYLDDSFITYRSPKVDGKKMSYLKLCWDKNLDCWDPFVQSLISVLNAAGKAGYCFPDLFTDGNILYSLSKEQVTLIDNDGIQTENRFPYMVDFYSEKFVDKRIKREIFKKYFNLSECYFTKEYNTFAFYSWFYHYFLGINLPTLMCYSLDDVKIALKQIQISENSALWDSTFRLFSLHSENYLDDQLFHDLCQNFQVVQGDDSRKLIPR